MSSPPLPPNQWSPSPIPEVPNLYCPRCRTLKPEYRFYTRDGSLCKRCGPCRRARQRPHLGPQPFASPRKLPESSPSHTRKRRNSAPAANASEPRLKRRRITPDEHSPSEDSPSDDSPSDSPFSGSLSSLSSLSSGSLSSLSSLASGSLSSLSSLSSDSPPPEATPTSIIHITVGGNVRAEVKTSGPTRIIFISKSATSSDDYLDDTYTAPTTVVSARAGNGHPEVSTTCPNWIVIDTAPVANEEGSAEGGSAEERYGDVVVLD